MLPKEHKNNKNKERPIFPISSHKFPALPKEKPTNSTIITSMAAATSNGNAALGKGKLIYLKTNDTKVARNHTKDHTTETYRIS